jgi:signal recognition particle GTPase
LTGNDAIDQAKKFYNHTEFTGVIMTMMMKIDVGTKGRSTSDGAISNTTEHYKGLDRVLLETDTNSHE